MNYTDDQVQKLIRAAFSIHDQFNRGYPASHHSIMASNLASAIESFMDDIIIEEMASAYNSMYDPHTQGNPHIEGMRAALSVVKQWES